MEYKFLLADKTMLDDIYNLFLKRIDWMNRVGIRQWNVTNYTDTYSKSYYEKQIEEKHLYVATINDRVIGAIVVFEYDDRWKDDDQCSAYYLHNFVTDTQIKGSGKKILEFVEILAKKNSKTKLRLDCAEDNEVLNNYYEKAGYIMVGKCTEGLYVGNKREKNLK